MLAEKLNGLKVVLDHEELVEVLQFGDDMISATLGVKDGPVTAPLLKYNVTSDNSLIIRGLFDIIWNNIEFKKIH